MEQNFNKSFVLEILSIKLNSWTLAEIVNTCYLKIALKNLAWLILKTIKKSTLSL